MRDTPVVDDVGTGPYHNWESSCGPTCAAGSVEPSARQPAGEQRSPESHHNRELLLSDAVESKDLSAWGTYSPVQPHV